MMERAKQLGKIDARCILEPAGHLIDHAGRVTYELRGVAIAIHLNGIDSCQRLCDSLGDLRHDIDVAIGEKIGVLHTVVCFRLGLDAGGDTLAMCLLSGAVSLTLEARRLCLNLGLEVNYYLDYRTSETGNFYFCGCHMVNYYLDYRTSETNKAPSAGSTSVNYYLDYRTSETNGEVRTILQVVNYCLIYGASEATPASRVRTSSVSYYLVYGTFETERQRVAHRRMVNYYLDYRTSETPKWV